MECNLYNEKNELNELNSYNQNFMGMYCVCHRPFPDPEDPVPDEMIQCIICEDWYHTRHLGTEIPSNNFAEMICEACVTKHEFLLHYDEFILKKSGSEEIDVLGQNENGQVDTSQNKEESYCKKPKEKSSKACAKFWADMNWRKELCTCDECLKMYENEDVAFLLDSEDPVHLYEEKGKAKAREIVENHDRNFMNSMNRVQLVDCIAGYNDLKEHLAEYLKKFADNKKIVREEDIKEFFEGMNALGGLKCKNDEISLASKVDKPSKLMFSTTTPSGLLNSAPLVSKSILLQLPPHHKKNFKFVIFTPKYLKQVGVKAANSNCFIVIYQQLERWNSKPTGIAILRFERPE
ncbi:hypothetical protein NQ317_008308 [Molorchus minor]|uniref:Zinc finger PHD-type domain-containing protein n=1 Tax=Molorchus minor TaxID=1323400 RepID=A0ABQ9JD39_9CUCU|nr:hypothetical protein NQ317_008308 [Molorchus minor]